MLSPFKILAAYNDLNKIEGVAKEQKSMSVKIPQLLSLVVALIGTIGAPALAQNWVHGHVAVYTGFVAAAILLHAIFPSIFAAPSASDTQATGLSKAGIVLLVLMLAQLLPVQAKAQSAPVPESGIQNLYGAGLSYSVNGNPAVAGTGLYAHQLSSGTYAFTAVDVVPNTVKPFTVTSNIGVGVAQKAFSVGSVPIFVPTAAGVSWNGANAGWQWNGGALAVIALKNGTYLLPSVRFLKSSVSNGTGYQPIVGLLFGWGK